MKRIFLLLTISLFAIKTRSQDVVYAVVSDPNDWQLFMSNNLINTDLSNGHKLVVITLTASDEGNGTSSFNGSAIPYYVAKERGSVYSSKFVYDFAALSFPNTSLLPSAQTVTVYGKSLTKYVYGNVVNYFLRLPDGGPAGAGYAGTGNKSLKKFKDGTISSISSITNAATWNTWSELLTTIYFIMVIEKGADQQVWLNTTNLNTGINPNDNSDHMYAGMAAQEAVATRLWVGINEYVMDHSSNLAANLNNEEYQFATGAYHIFDWSLTKDKYSPKINSVRAWLPMEYTSVKRSPSGNSGTLPITLLNFSGSLKGNNVLLDWSTSLEINSKEFQIEKSNDGITYRKLYTTPAAGNSTIVKKYNYLDIEATEVNYYRLKMLDVDGFTKQSDVIIVKNPGLSQTVSTITNPFKDHISVRFAKIPKGGVSLKLIDLSGRVISTGEVYNSISSIIRFDYNKTLSQGIYILQVTNDGKQYSFKLVKE